ncbi:MAG TPA: hypothetical protein VF150_01275 [Thermoanaerobaculia bacterium]
MKRIWMVALCLGLAAPAARAEVVMERLDVDPWTVTDLLARGEPRPGGGAALAPAEGGGDGPRTYLIPYTTAKSLSGVTTLFALVNCNQEPVDVDLEYYNATWKLKHSETRQLAANAQTAVNLRDRIAHGISLEGMVRVVSSRRILVDHFLVETGAGRASGGGALSYGDNGYSDVVPVLATRAFGGGALGLGTAYRLFLTKPQGDRPGIDPASVLVFVFDRDGVFAGGLLLGVSENLVSLAFADIAAALGFQGGDAKLIIMGNSAAVAAELGIEAPSEDVMVGGWVIFNAGTAFNVGDKIRRASELNTRQLSSSWR